MLSRFYTLVVGVLSGLFFGAVETLAWLLFFCFSTKEDLWDFYTGYPEVFFFFNLIYLLLTKRNRQF